VNPLRYLARALGFSWLAYGRPSGRRVGVLAGRAIGGWLAGLLLGRR
jgi:hypothetical protein